MSKRKTKRQAQKLYNNLKEISNISEETKITSEINSCSEIVIGLSNTLISNTNVKQELTKMKKFRFQLLHQWIIENFNPCRVADIGGGKGLLTYLLQKSGWEATVIDPVHQPLPNKYKDIVTNKQTRITSAEFVPHIDQEFNLEMAQKFDLLVGMHAHGCNVKIIDAAKKFGRGFILMPCCIIDEPLYPESGVHWLECLAEYAVKKGFVLHTFRLNFRGQNIGLYAEGMK